MICQVQGVTQVSHWVDWRRNGKVSPGRRPQPTQQHRILQAALVQLELVTGKQVTDSTA